uniref:Uncharacterized protein n=1 Tax=Ditylenchus dipsaci TaxID=166011 RepID=A0A915EPZ0_9BILA
MFPIFPSECNGWSSCWPLVPSASSILSWRARPLVSGKNRRAIIAARIPRVANGMIIAFLPATSTQCCALVLVFRPRPRLRPRPRTTRTRTKGREKDEDEYEPISGSYYEDEDEYERILKVGTRTSTKNRICVQKVTAVAQLLSYKTITANPCGAKALLFVITCASDPKSLNSKHR